MSVNLGRARATVPQQDKIDEIHHPNVDNEVNHFAMLKEPVGCTTKEVSRRRDMTRRIADKLFSESRRHGPTPLFKLELPAGFLANYLKESKNDLKSIQENTRQKTENKFEEKVAKENRSPDTTPNQSPNASPLHSPEKKPLMKSPPRIALEASKGPLTIIHI